MFTQTRRVVSVSLTKTILSLRTDSSRKGQKNYKVRTPEVVPDFSRFRCGNESRIDKRNRDDSRPEVPDVRPTLERNGDPQESPLNRPYVRCIVEGETTGFVDEKSSSTVELTCKQTKKGKSNQSTTDQLLQKTLLRTSLISPSSQSRRVSSLGPPLLLRGRRSRVRPRQVSSEKKNSKLPLNGYTYSFTSLTYYLRIMKPFQL